METLLILQRYGINMTKLESRPIMGNPWEEMFYVDLEAHLDSDNMQQANYRTNDNYTSSESLRLLPKREH